MDLPRLKNTGPDTDMDPGHGLDWLSGLETGPCALPDLSSAQIALPTRQADW